jgi:hypothetical protein
MRNEGGEREERERGGKGEVTHAVSGLEPMNESESERVG